MEEEEEKDEEKVGLANFRLVSLALRGSGGRGGRSFSFSLSPTKSRVGLDLFGGGVFVDS